MDLSPETATDANTSDMNASNVNASKETASPVQPNIGKVISLCIKGLRIAGFIVLVSVLLFLPKVVPQGCQNFCTGLRLYVVSAFCYSTIIWVAEVAGFTVLIGMAVEWCKRKVSSDANMAHGTAKLRTAVASQTPELAKLTFASELIEAVNQRHAAEINALCTERDAERERADKAEESLNVMTDFAKGLVQAQQKGAQGVEEHLKKAPASIAMPR